MPHPENARGPWIYACHRVLPSWLVLLLGLIWGVMGTIIMVSAEAATLNEVRIGNHGAYIRIVFELSNQAQYQLEEDTRAGIISVRFLGTNTTISEKLETAPAGCFQGLTTLQPDEYVIAQLRFNPGWSKLNPFILREPDRMVLDVFCGEEVSTDRLQPGIQAEQAAQVQEIVPENRSETPEAVSTLTKAAQVETETIAIVAKEPPAIESTTPSSIVTESQIQGSNPGNNQAAKPLATVEVAPQKKDPFQKYLLILLAAITGIIVLLIALIVIQKRRQSARLDVVGDNALEPDETIHAIDKQIKAKLMKYDDQ